jgi:arylsulfatase A-like enzyme
VRAVLVWLAAAALAAPAAAVRPAEPPNFIVIVADDLGYGDVGPFGSKRHRTPELDRMASEGRRLASFYGAPVCSPSRASLLSGSYAQRVGIPYSLFPASRIGLAAGEHTLPELLRARGYATACVGKWHLGDQPEFLPTRHGCDRYLGLPYSNDLGPPEDLAEGPPGTAARAGAEPPRPPLPLLSDEKVVARVRAAEQRELLRRYTDEAVAFVRAHAEGPFFLYLAPAAVHAPWFPGAAFQGRSGNGPYADLVEELDWSVGRVLAAVRELGLEARTFVLFSSDNGAGYDGSNAPLRGHKGSTLEGGVRVPTLAWWPGRIPAGTSSDEVAGMIDVLPTLVKLAGGEVPADRRIDGRDVLPLLAGDPGARSPHEAFYLFRGDALEAVRSGPWKLHLASSELYDVARDPGESRNLAPEHPDVVARLRALAARTETDLGLSGDGPGCRAPGTVASARPLIGFDGRIRPGFAPE